jgi:hypothetical protein
VVGDDAARALLRRRRATLGGAALLVATFVGVPVFGAACLGSLPPPTTCPPDAVYPACPLRAAGGPLPSPSGTLIPSGTGTGAPPPTGTTTGTGAPTGTGTGSPPDPSGTATGTADAPAPTPGLTGGAPGCSLDGIPCLRDQGRACICTPAAECARTTASCSPPPECPASITNAAGASARCLEAPASFAPETPPGCTCGCASCAAICDGQGPVVGPGQIVRYQLPNDLPASGALGLMARLRGGGQAVFLVDLGGGAATPLGSVPADSEFADNFPKTSAGLARYAWTEGQPRPVAIELHADPLGPVEVDCVVPFLSP